ncbi:MAG: hypothetical protein KGM24_04520 [Elusimicrobia bacterium]|nr:hypothetical protein [Elusimicrobiota bacterium]
MGEAYTAVADGPDAAYWNPAGLAWLKGGGARYARSELPAGVHHDFAAVALPAAWAHGGFAFSLTRLSQDSLALVDASNTTEGSFSPHSEAYALSYGARISGESPRAVDRDYFRGGWEVPSVDRPYLDELEPWTGQISVGATIKAVHEDLGTRSAVATAFDAGAMFRPEDLSALTLAAAVRNVGTKLRFISESEPLPGELAAAAAYDLRGDEWALLPAVEADLPYAGDPYGKLGVEARRSVSRSADASLRLGYTSRTAASLGALSGLTAGVGLRAGAFSFDAAFEPMGVLGQGLRLGVGWDF